MCRVWLVLLAACGSPAPQVLQPELGTSTVRNASCQDTLACYSRCSPLTDPCVGACDQRTTPDRASRAHAALQCMAQSDCVDESCARRRCAEPLNACMAGSGS